MRPRNTKNYARDWNKSRRWRRGGWENPPKLNGVHSMIAYFPKKESRIKGNRAVRRYKKYIPNGCAYKKVYDVEWEVY